MASRLSLRGANVRLGLRARPRRIRGCHLRCRRRSAHVAEAAARVPDFGPNVKIFDPSMSTSQIKATVDAIADQQLSNQFGTQRYALLFKPGTYGTRRPIRSTSRSATTPRWPGLGASPNDVAVNGTIDVYNQCFGPGDCTALVNFWRSLSNLTINVAGKGGCQSGEFWATSQAAPMRRVHVNGFTTLMDYCTGPSFASGGFIADSQFSGSTVVNGSQQQYLVRNSSLGGWTNGVWNQVFAGVQGAPAQSFPSPPYTTLDTNPASREKPFLYVDAKDRYNVFVPDAQLQLVRHDVGQRPDARPLDPDRETSSSRSRPTASSRSTTRSRTARTSSSRRASTTSTGRSGSSGRTRSCSGSAWRRSTAENGVVPMTVADVKGVDIAGLIFDAGAGQLAGAARSSVRRSASTAGARAQRLERPERPERAPRRVLPHRRPARRQGDCRASRSDSDDAILDDIWAWRADHGNGVGWTSNTADTGVVVNGDDVVATGLFAEHFQKYEVFWAGENGKTIMFQNEMPYDPPNQAAWQHGGVLGWAAYKVADWVKTHEGWGLGSYCFLNVDPTIHASRAFEVPVTPGVKLHDILSLSITNNGTIDHVVNDVGAPTTRTRPRSTSSRTRSPQP